MRASLLLLLLLVGGPVRAQVDSLREALNGETVDTLRLAMLDRLASAHLFKDPDSALHYGQRMFDLAEELGVGWRSARALNLMGRAHHLKGAHAPALACFHDALRRFERSGNRRSVAATRSNIGSLYTDEGRLEKAIEAYRASMAAYHEVGDVIWEMGAAYGLAEVYERMGEDDSAQALYGRAADVLARIDAREHAAMARLEQARLVLGLHRDSLAEAFYRDALALLGASDNDFARCSILSGLARALVRLGRDAEARPLFLLALRIAGRSDFRQELADLGLALSRLCERAGEPDSALSYLKLHLQWRDSLFSAERARAIVEVQERFDSERKDVAIAHQQALLDRRSTLIRVVAAAAAMLLLAALLAWRAYRLKKRTSDLLAGRNALIGAALKEKELLLHELHHRVKNNMQTVGSLLRLQAREESDQGTRAALHEAMMRVKSLALVHQDLYRDASLTGVHMDAYIGKLARGLLRSHAMDQRIALALDVQPVRLQVDSAVPLGLILNELITNALKHAFPSTPGRGAHDDTLAIALRDQGDLLVLEVRDNGVGYRAHNPAGPDDAQRLSGTGILATFAETLRAEWTVLSNGGTTVRFAVRNFARA
ncbi:MAG TPA: histidine kinase dimerization/phosphoacceptor domain -containing protein [Flavobacteriales bacterium]|nr:histidine kinase dimerization/phosphoacceptor domain -containing protein [Flavobacteriales bacterium]HMR26145.1 histidine kinase dimerization/phosphoacceptor domain -containing protein [Flavobacteriales bacterium]